MNKSIVSIFLISCLCYGFTACNQCINCKAIQTVGNLTVETPYKQFCGNSEDVTAYEKGLKNQAPENVTIECVNQ